MKTDANSHGEMTYADAAIKVLESAGEPLHYKDITDRALDQGYCTTNSQTPDQSMYTAISYLHLPHRRGSPPSLDGRDAAFSRQSWAFGAHRRLALYGAQAASPGG